MEKRSRRAMICNEAEGYLLAIAAPKIGVNAHPAKAMRSSVSRCMKVAVCERKRNPRVAVGPRCRFERVSRRCLPLRNRSSDESC